MSSVRKKDSNPEPGHWASPRVDKQVDGQKQISTKAVELSCEHMVK
jgi:hypothetical protein